MRVFLKFTDILSVISLMFLVASCQGLPAQLFTAKSDITPSPEVIATAWTAEIEGKLVISDGCLRIKNTSADYALAWPADYLTFIQGEKITIKTGLVYGTPGELILTVGSSIHLSGGETQQLSEDLRRTLAPGCIGPYWVVGNELTAIP